MAGEEKNKMRKRSLTLRIAGLPPGPGVYIFKDGAGNTLYIGKANCLRKRVQSYFNRPLDAKTQALVDRIRDIEFRLTANPTQARVLEDALIKERQPPYNIELKDDKSFPFLKISAEEFPALSICRRKKIIPGDRSLYFGPYPQAKHLHQAFDFLRQAFGFRTCRKMPKDPCLYYRLQLCPAPCCGKISRQDYAALLGRIKLFLRGEYQGLAAELARKMQAAGQRRDFEAAALLRDQLQALASVSRGAQELSARSGLEELQRVLKIPRPLQRIEAFDISNISGKEACGSMVSFAYGFPDKNNYRRFRVETVSGSDDYAMLREVVRRRYARLAAESAPLPDLVFVDGGKGQLLAACAEIARLSLKIPVASIAKERENIYFAGRGTLLRLAEGDPALNLIRRIRDEAHRFAVSYHRVLRRKKTIGK
jgi:excinuclease ABC subunit C